MNITGIVKSIQDVMRQDAGVDGDAQRISQLVWMIFMKIFDDKEYEYELMDEKYRSPMPERLRWRNWAADEEGMTGDELLDFINNDLFKTLKELSIDEHSDPRGLMVKEVFEDAYNYMKSGTLLRQVINKINQGIDFNKSEDRHICHLITTREDIIMKNHISRVDVLSKVFNDMLADRFQGKGENGNVFSLLQHLSVSIIDPRYKVSRLIEDGRPGSLQKCEAHLLGDRPEPSLQQGS